MGKGPEARVEEGMETEVGLKQGGSGDAMESTAPAPTRVAFVILIMVVESPEAQKGEGSAPAAATTPVPPVTVESEAVVAVDAALLLLLPPPRSKSAPTLATAFTMAPVKAEGMPWAGYVEGVKVFIPACIASGERELFTTTRALKTFARV